MLRCEAEAELVEALDGVCVVSSQELKMNKQGAEQPNNCSSKPGESKAGDGRLAIGISLSFLLAEDSGRVSESRISLDVAVVLLIHL